MRRARSSFSPGKGPADEYTAIMEGCGDAARFALATTDQCTLVVRASQFEPEDLAICSWTCSQREEEHELTVQALVKVDADENQVPSDASSQITPRKGHRL